MSASSKKKNLAKKAGWLEKKGDKGPVKIWRIRYFVETEKGTVQYFTSTDLTQETYRGQIDLHDVLSVSKSIEVDVTQSEQNKLEFNVLVKSGRIFRLRVDTQEERKQWMTIFGSKLLRAREQQQRPIPATSPPPDPKDFNTFDFHAHTMPAYVMKQLYEESQQQPQKEKHPGSKLERSHSAENARAQVITQVNSPYGKLSAAPIIVGKNKFYYFLCIDLTTAKTNNNLPRSYGLMPKPETLKAMKEQQRTSHQLSSFKEGYLHLIQNDPEKYLHIANNGQQAPANGPPTSYERLSKYNLESSTHYQHYTDSRQSLDYTRQSGLVAKTDQKELERLEKLLMEEEGRGSIYGQPMKSFLMEDEPVNKSENDPVTPVTTQPRRETTQESSPATKKSYNYGSLAAVHAKFEGEPRHEPVSHSGNSTPTALKTNRRSSLELYQPIPSSLSPPQIPNCLAEEKKERSGSVDNRGPEYGCLPSIRDSQIAPEILAILEASHRTPPASPTKSTTPQKFTPTQKSTVNHEHKVRVSESDILYSSQEINPNYLQLPSYDNPPHSSQSTN